jgi:D-cysteine desulfhydrase
LHQLDLARSRRQFPGLSEPLLYERFPELRGSLPHVALGSRPTPVRRLERLEGMSGRGEIWAKDDGVFGGAWGGNKARKLEWILPDVRRKRRRSILTVGALATNHGLATALYAREQGLRTILALVDQPLDDHVMRQRSRIERSGALVYRTHGTLRTIAALPYIYAAHTDWRRLRPPYFLTIGGSSPLGSLGYVEAALELAGQVERGELPEPAHVVVALGSGGTAAGLVLGLKLAGLGTRVVAIQVNDRTPLDPARVARLAGRARRLLERRGARLEPGSIAAEDLQVEKRWLGAGYGHRTAEAERAIGLAREEGLALEPVYTGKAMAALLALRERGELGDGPVLYWHTHNALAVT